MELQDLLPVDTLLVEVEVEIGVVLLVAVLHLVDLVEVVLEVVLELELMEPLILAVEAVGDLIQLQQLLVPVVPE
jgi:hypothetical protein